MSDLQKFIGLAAQFPETTSAPNPEHNILRDLLAELKPLSGSCNLNYDFHEDGGGYDALRALDLHMLHRIAQVLPHIRDNESNAVLIGHLFNHIFNTVEGVHALQEFVNSTFAKDSLIAKSFYVSYGLEEHNYDEHFFKMWKEQFGNPPPIEPSDYLDAARLPVLTDNLGYRVFQDPSVP